MTRLPIRSCAILLASFLLLALSACDSSDDVETFPLDVQVRYPDGYAQAEASGVDVTLQSLERDEERTAATGAGGVARFEDVAPGTYTLSANRSLSEDEAFDLTGVRSSVELNANMASREILSAPTEPLELTLAGSALGGLVIGEMYYTGSATPSGGSYFSDQFIEVYNNSTETIYADGLYVADVYGTSGQINPGSTPTPFQDDEDHVYLSSVWRIPGDGEEHPLAPGESIIIAQDGIAHRSDPNGNPNSPVNLDEADWETYNQREDERDTDAPGVPNLEKVYYNGGFDWLVPVFGPGLVLFRTDDFESLEMTPIPGAPDFFAPRVKLPVENVVDAFEALQNAQSGSFKRIPASLDAGFVYASGTYVSESAQRKVARVIDGRVVLQDTNDSSSDFEILATPTPRAWQ